ncbi:MAG: AMP-binding protein [Phycisphaera sp.]|nr:AMP-binding protein [Phycisphaera sp.]
MNSLAEILFDHRERNPDREVFRFRRSGEADEVQTWSDLALQSEQVASRLQSGGVHPGDRVLIVLPPGLGFISALCGCFAAGVIAVPTFPPNLRKRTSETDRFDSILGNAEPRACITSSSMREDLERHVQSVRSPRSAILWVSMEDLRGDEQPAWNRPVYRSDDVSLLQYTSGSTGSPKGVMVSQRNILENVRVMSSRLELTPEDRGVCWLPPYHDMGLMGGFMQTIYVGYETIWMAPVEFLKRPRSWLEAMTACRATITGAPNFAYDLCVDKVGPDDRAGLDFSHWRNAINGAEPISARTIDRFVEAFGPQGYRRGTFFPCYGLAEATLMISGSPSGDAPVIRSLDKAALKENRIRTASGEDPTREGFKRAVSSGNVVAEHEVVVVDPDRQAPVGPGTVGEIWFQGPSVGMGYWGDSEGSKSTFENRLEGSDARFLRTGDSGCLVDGELFLTGRIKDLIIIRGRNHWPNDLEETALESSDSLQVGCIAAFSDPAEDHDQLVIAAEVRRECRKSVDGAAVAHAIREAVNLVHGVNATIIVLLPPGSIPRTTSGKVRRRDCIRRFKEGSWNPIESDRIVHNELRSGGFSDPRSPASRCVPSRRQLADVGPATRCGLLEDYLCDIFADEKPGGPPGITADTTLASIGVDSIRQVELVLQIEADLMVDLPIEMVDPACSIAEIASSIGEGLLSGRSREHRTEPVQDPSAGEDAEVPMLPAQSEYLHPGLERSGSFLIVGHLRTPIGLDPEILERAVRNVCGRHDAFLMRYRMVDGAWRQHLDPDGERITFVHKTARIKDAWDESIGRDWLRNFIDPEMDLADGPLARAMIVERDPMTPGMMVLAFHHLVFDAISTPILVLAIERECRRLAGSEHELDNATPTPEHSFVDWAHQARKRACEPEVRTQVEYWMRNPEHKAWRVRSSGSAYEDARRSITLEFGPDLAGRIRRNIPGNQRQHDAMLAVLLNGWQKVTGRERCRVMLRHHGRQAFGGQNPMRIIGWFAHNFPVDFDLAGMRNTRDAIDRVRETIVAVPGRGIPYSLARHMSDDPELRRRLDAESVVDMEFSYLGTLKQSARNWGMLPLLSTYTVHGHQVPDSVVVPLRGLITLDRSRFSYKVSLPTAALDPDEASALEMEIRSQVESLAGS